MKLAFTKHARQVMANREIPEDWVERTVGVELLGRSKRSKALKLSALEFEAA